MLDEGVLYMMCLEILVGLCGGLPTEPDSLYAGYSGCLYCSVYEEGHVREDLPVMHFPLIFSPRQFNGYTMNI